jgi:Fic family protein
MGKSSTKRKGATSYKDTAFGIIPRSKLVKLEIEGTKKGLEYLGDLLQKQKSAEITLDLILELHWISFGWIFPKWAGKLRAVQVTFSGKEALPFYQLSELIINLCRDIEKRISHLSNPAKESFILEVVSLLAWFQHKFVFIHPFQDYNGRIARMLTVLILLRLGLPPIELKSEKESDRRSYLTAMQKADGGDLSFLEKLISQALNEILESIKKL